MIRHLANLHLPSGRQVQALITARRGTKRLTLRVDPIKRHVMVSGPARVKLSDALGFAHQNSGWIDARLTALPLPAPFEEGASFLFRGRPTKLVRKPGRQAASFHDGQEPILEIFAPPQRMAGRTKLALKALAHGDAYHYVQVFSAKLGKAPNTITIRDTRSRWGSCTANGDIMLSWRLIGAPPKVFEYVVAHEMAHLVELNHSNSFWMLVTSLMPDWKPARAWLRAHGDTLLALGF
ncbi:M48 family metallopeptidase [Candidatus Phycosocius spiralis]|uniref:Metal-dependent hydrolase n=1 Tax=Candidatus Phycosocius spiralis TaxID=2815099 RepID=A0ABQ4PXF2_9PROT|nr:SprT family zinc-dependent metalloprotease [Candidatus Phycosocius spiralis]GIU67677.1 metal-dependent hydrolase [Candidatus Phycosocius spiralis]